MGEILAWITANPALVAAIAAAIYALTPPGSPLHKILEMLRIVQPTPQPGPAPVVPPAPLPPSPVVPVVPTPEPQPPHPDRPVIDALVKILPTILPVVLPLLAEQAKAQSAPSAVDATPAKKGRS